MGGYSLLKNVFPNFKNSEINKPSFKKDDFTPVIQPLAYKSTNQIINDDPRLDKVFYKPAKPQIRETFTNSCDHILYCDLCRKKLLSLLKKKRTFYDDFMDFLFYIICLLFLILLLERFKI
jgi:hypothetical protein